MRELRNRFEVSLASRVPGRTNAAIWNMSPSLLASYLDRSRIGAVCAFELSSARDVMPDLVRGLAAFRIGSGTASVVLTPDARLMDHIAEQPPSALWGFSISILDAWPDEWERRAVETGADPKELAARLRVRFHDGATWLEGPTADVEQLVTSALLDRILGAVVPVAWAVPELMGQARETGVLLFKDLIQRESEVRATVLHACNFGVVRPLVRKTRSSDRVGATGITITETGEIRTARLPARPLRAWLGAGRLRLWWASRGLVSSDDEAWRDPRGPRAPTAKPASVEPAAATPVRAGGVLVLNGRQRAVEAALAKKSGELVRFYVGALSAVTYEANPDRLAQAAHGLRELMEKFPKYVDVAIPAHGEKLGVKVNELEVTWNRAIAKSKCRRPDGAWVGEIDRPASELLSAIDALFGWKKEHMPRRQAEIAQTLVQLDPAARPLPAPLQKLNVNLWADMREFFQKVAHHGYVCTIVEFAEWVEALELFLIERLQPRTFDDFSAIDAILDESREGKKE